MSYFLGAREHIDETMGLPEERWLQALDEATDWSGLVSRPAGNLAEAETVFRQLWATAEVLQRGKPRQFFVDGLDTPAAKAACAALRAIGASRLADTIEGPRPDGAGVDSASLEQRLAADDSANEVAAELGRVRSLLISYLDRQGVFPLEPKSKTPRLPAIPAADHEPLERMMGDRNAAAAALEARIRALEKKI